MRQQPQTEHHAEQLHQGLTDDHHRGALPTRRQGQREGQNDEGVPGSEAECQGATRIEARPQNWRQAACGPRSARTGVGKQPKPSLIR